MTRLKHGMIVKLDPTKVVESATPPAPWETPGIRNRNWYRVVGKAEFEKELRSGSNLAFWSSMERARREFANGFPFYLNPVADLSRTGVPGAHRRGSDSDVTVRIKLPELVWYGAEKYWIVALRTAKGVLEPCLMDEMAEVVVEPAPLAQSSGKTED